jgi:hypothetical protein
MLLMKAGNGLAMSNKYWSPNHAVPSVQTQCSFFELNTKLHVNNLSCIDYGKHS